MAYDGVEYERAWPLSPVQELQASPFDGTDGGRQGSLSTQRIARKPLSQPTIAIHPDHPPPPPPHRIEPRIEISDDFDFSFSSSDHSRNTSREVETPEPDQHRDSASSLPVTQTIPFRQGHSRESSSPRFQAYVAEIGDARDGVNRKPSRRAGSSDDDPVTPTSVSTEDQEQYPQLQYHHQPYPEPAPRPRLGDEIRHGKSQSVSSGSIRSASDPDAVSVHSGRHMALPRSSIARPASAYTLGSELNVPGRTHSPRLSVGGSPTSNGSPRSYGRNLGALRRSPDARPVSYVDLLNIPYAQQVAPTQGLVNSQLRQSVGTNAALLDTKKTLDMYRGNVKKTNEPSISYEFAVFMVNAAKEAAAGEAPDVNAYNDLLREARQILSRLSDRSYPFAQYYLGDGYASGMFNKGKEDWDRAFPLFVAASKHGHAEAAYRAALCYEFGWGCRKDYAKAVQFYRASASKNHPGAATRLGKACLTGDMGLLNKYREGLKWLKRAAESADATYNSAPYELGLLHEAGFGPDCFKDEAYAAQLFTQSAELGHADAALRMGDAYEHGRLTCPRDPALSVHFYHTAAQGGLPDGMMCLCAWYMVGAEPVLDKDENEAYEWAKKAAEFGLAKAEYAIGYFTEMGIGCRRDPLEANVWYVRAADQGDERARQRLAIIRAAASGDPGIPSSVGPNEKSSNGNGATQNTLTKTKGGKDGKECIVM